MSLGIIFIPDSPPFHIVAKQADRPRGDRLADHPRVVNHVRRPSPPFLRQPLVRPFCIRLLTFCAGLSLSVRPINESGRSAGWLHS